MIKKLFDKKGVVSVGKGFKFKNGKQTDQICTVVGVEKKLPLKDIHINDVIPAKTDDGMITDVIQVGKIKALENTAKMRPCPPSYSIGHPDITAGTLGCYVKNNMDQTVILSNNHVLAASNNAQFGDIIVQPGVHDGGKLQVDDFAILKDFIPIEMIIGTPDCDIVKSIITLGNFFARCVGSSHRLSGYRRSGATNLVDAAVALPISPADVDENIPGIGVPKTITELELGMAVHKNGRTTEYTTGEVTQTDVTVNVGYGGANMATFEDQIVVTGDFSAPGDSGSAVLHFQKLGGLLFAGGENVTIVNRIQNVFELLQLHI
jgi:hypothetical protein